MARCEDERGNGRARSATGRPAGRHTRPVRSRATHRREIMLRRAALWARRARVALAIAACAFTPTALHAKAKPKAGIVLEGINSHGGGRATATSSEADWDAKAYQRNYNQVLAALAVTNRLNLDQQHSGQYSTSTTLCNPST